MTIVAEHFAYVIGIDTHAKTHTYAIIETRTGASTGCKTFPTTDEGIARAITWIRNSTTGEILAAVEGTGSYGAVLSSTLIKAGIRVAEVKPPTTKARAGKGKTDAIDAHAAATGVLGTEVELLVQPRADGPRQALAVLLAGRKLLETHRTANRNALNALVRKARLGIDTRKALTDKQVTLISTWTPLPQDSLEIEIIREEAAALATSILAATARLKANLAKLRAIVTDLAPWLLTQPGIGPFTAAILLCTFSHPGRIHSDAAFSALGGISPVQASSGNTIRHRLNRRGDRQLNRALHIITKSRLTCHQETKDYLARRTKEGLSKREITRCLKRAISRSLYRALNANLT